MSKSPAMTDQDLQRLTDLLKLLSDPTRLQILVILAGGERNVSNLCETLKLPQPTVSHHLGLLRLRNIITSRKSGKQVFYNLHPRVLADSGALTVAIDHVKVEISPVR